MKDENITVVSRDAPRRGKTDWAAFDALTDADIEAAMAKDPEWADMVMMVADRAVQILGGHGYIREHPVEMWMRNARGFSTFTGLSIV